MLGGDNLISQPSLTTAKAPHQNLAIGNRGPGGQLSLARPPGRVRGAPQARKAKKKPGRVIPGRQTKKT
jgi:hypothetical protein